MIQIMFVTVSNHVPFLAKDRTFANKTIFDFLDLMKRVTKEEDQLLFAEDKDGKIAMVRVSQVVGFYTKEFTEDESTKKLAEAQCKIASVMERSLKNSEEGDEWKKGRQDV